MVDGVSRRYEIVCRLAGGGMADLYLARTLGPGGFERLVVIKRIAKRLASQASAVQALFDEARIAATLSHANIVQVNDIEIADGQVSIVMEFLHGHDVSHLLRRMKRANEHVPLDQAVAITQGVCAGLHHAHERMDSAGKSLAIVHRDVSPHNVFVTYDGAVKLVDFGIARASVRKGHTDHGFIKGKPGYIAPEQIKGRKTDRRTDVWGAAVLLYELTTGRTPYGISTAFDELVKVTKEDPPPPSSHVRDYPLELEAIVLRGLARDPAQRYSSAEEMRVALDEFARNRGLDLSPFRMAALMERVFAENLEAWRQSQRLGKTLAEHVAAFKTSGAHEIVALPGDPTEPFESFDITHPVGTSDFASRPITAPTRMLRPSANKPSANKPSAFEGPTEIAERTPTTKRFPAPQSPAPPAPPPVLEVKATTSKPPYDTSRPTPMAFESLQFAEATTVPREKQSPFLLWRTRIALGLAAPLVVILSVLAWRSLDANSSPAPQPARQPRATAVVDEPVAQPMISVVPIESEPAATKPVASEPSIEISTAVAHASPSPARKRPSAKPTPKKKPVRTVQPTRAVSPSPPQQAAEDDLDALLPH